MRCFISINLPEELKSPVSSLKKEINTEGIKPVEDKNLHITLKFLGNVPVEKLGEIEQALRNVEFSKFKIKLKKVGVFPNESYIRVVWIGCENSELEDLSDKINESLSGLFKKEPFSAHLTIARVRRKTDLSNFLEKHREDEFGEFEVSNFELKSSKLSKEGPEYSTVAVFQAKE